MLYYDESTLAEKKTYKVLIVEDSELMNKTICNMLREFGCYKLDTTFDFKQAKLALEKNIYDFIILDLNLPDAYGEELVKNIKSLSKSKIIVFDLRSRCSNARKSF